MKIKEICEKTGLTDRTVRYYIEEGLISPFYTENYLGRKAFDFSEQDLEDLNNIAILRAFGFSVDEIKELSLRDSSNQQIVEAVKNRTKECLDKNNRQFLALSGLELSDATEISELAKKLSESDLVIENENANPNIKRRILSFLESCIIFLAVWLPIVMGIAVLVFKFTTLNSPIVRPDFLAYTLLCFLPSMATVTIFKKTKAVRKTFRIILITLCLLCLPLGVFFSSKSIIVCEHNYQAYRTVVEATCQREGESLLKCESCENFKTQKLKKLSHTPVIVKGVEPTCSENGTSDGCYCSFCDEVLIKQKTIPPTNFHTLVIDAAIPATCIKDGLTEGMHCSVCKATLLTQEVITAKGHSYQEQIIPQSCGVDGCILYECSCGDSYKTNVVRATNMHDFQNNYNGIGHTCQTCGLEVIAHGTVDGSIPEGNDTIKFYITGSENFSLRTMVIYGNGKMPDFESGDEPAWTSNRYYLNEVTTIIIESGVTYIGNYAFNESFYYNVDELIIRSSDIRFNDYHYSFAGINTLYCKIIYDY